MELGLYVPTELTRGNTFYVTGHKLRVKWIPLQPQNGVGNFGGINGELAHVGSRFEASRNALELRPIFGYRDTR